MLRIVFCIVAAFAAATASAADGWRHLQAQPPRAVEPEHFLVGSDGALWLFGADGIRRTDAAGATTGWLQALPYHRFLASLPTREPVGAYVVGQPTADRGAVFMAPNTCLLTRVDAAVRLRWVQRIDADCDFTVADDGAVWAAASYGMVYRIGADGTIETRVGAEPGIAHVAPMPLGGVAVVRNLQQPQRMTLTHYDSYGTAWWTLERNLQLADVAASADGTLTVAGIANGGVAVYRFDSNGTPVAQYAAPRDPDVDALTLALAPDGSASVATTRAGEAPTLTVYRFDSAGRFAWRAETCVRASNASLPPDAVLPLAGGDVAVACSRRDAARFVRFDARGAAVAEATLPTQNAQLGLRADGLLQALGTDGATGVARPFVVDRDGQTVDAPVPTADEPVDLVDQAFAEDASWLLSRSALRAGPQRLVLSKLDANGVVAWQRVFDAIAPHARLVLGGDRVCVAQSRALASRWWGAPAEPPAPVSITCIATADGADRWSRTYPTDSAEHRFGMTADGTFVHLRSAGSTHEIVRHDAAGNTRTSGAQPGFVQSAAIGATGDVVVGLRDPDTTAPRLVRYDAHDAAHPVAVHAPDGLEVLGTVGGQIHVFASFLSMHSHRWFGADGRQAWSRSVNFLSERPVPDAAGAAVYIVESVPGASVLAPAVRVVRLRTADGETVWRSAAVFLTPDDIANKPPTLDVSGDVVALVHATRHRIHAVRFDTRDGATIGERVEWCAAYCGRQRAIAVDARGVVRVALPLVDVAATAVTAAVVALPDTSTQPAVRLDQAGLGGAWWAPYANGEGFVVDWLPATRTWFMPWFTFARFDDGYRNLRWFTVAGTIAAGATQADLPILATTGGTFDAGGGTTARRVGTATLRFTDCNNGTLRYAFDAGTNGRATGTVTLSRLSAATSDCVLADGTVQSHATPPAGGFDARMSGSWYEESTSGQGLQFTVQPGGVFFAPWFTFDPPGALNNPSRQHWYTLQGSLADAAQGRVTVSIVESTGGAFDAIPASDMAIVGTATLTLLACDRATLDYAFGATAGDLAGRSGTLDLVKAGGCAP
jgi:hypothetical protein